jgi:hemerythrin superfamily protein
MMATETATRATITDLLRQDHKKMKRLFNEFERSEGRERERIVSDALSLIETHDVVEQTLLYPSVKGVSDISRHLVLRCEEAHHVVRLLMAELKVKPYSERYFAKFSKMADGIVEHIEEEEQELFPAIEGSSEIDVEDLGRRMLELKESQASMFLRTVSGRGGVFAGAALLAGIGWAVYQAFSNQE